MRRLFGNKPTRFERGDAVRLKTDLPSEKLRSGMVGTISEVRRTKLPSYNVQFIDTSGVVGRFVVDETDLMPADGRRYDDNDVVRLVRDVPSEGLSSGTVGIVSTVIAGPPVRYEVEFVGADGSVMARTTLEDGDLSSPNEARAGREAQEAPGSPGAPAAGVDAAGEGTPGTGLADEELDELIAELRSQGKAMQQQGSQGRPEQTPAEPVTEPPAAPPADTPEEQPEDGTSSEPPSDGRRTRFVRGETVRLVADLPSAGVDAGTEGTVTWAILGPPVAYLVEFRQAGGGTTGPTKVEETYLSFGG